MSGDEDPGVERPGHHPRRGDGPYRDKERRRHRQAVVHGKRREHRWDREKHRTDEHARQAPIEPGDCGGDPRDEREQRQAAERTYEN